MGLFYKSQTAEFSQSDEPSPHALPSELAFGRESPRRKPRRRLQLFKLASRVVLPNRLARAAPGEHAAQLFASSAGRKETVVRFGREGLARGQGVILVMSSKHATPVRRELLALGTPVEELEEAGDLIFEDAERLLDVLAGPDGLDGDGFRKAIDLAIDRARRVRKLREVRIYAEIVELIRGRRRMAAASRAEKLLNEVVQRRDVALLCGYGQSGPGQAVPTQLARAHTRVYRQLSSRKRLMRAARELFSEGYEQTTTAAIARRAGSSESQIIKHFGGKEGLLREVIERWWEDVLREVDEVVARKLPADEALPLVFQVVGEAFREDDRFAGVMLFEGRRIRRGRSDMNLSDGFLRFGEIVERIFEHAKRAGRLREGLTPETARDAVLGAGEGLVRSRLMASRSDYPASYGVDEERDAFATLLGALLVDTPPPQGDRDG